MTNAQYGRYLYRRIIKKSPYPEITAPAVSFKPAKGTGNPQLAVEWCCISQPFQMKKRPVREDFDRFLVFAGGDPLNPDDFQAEVEISLGEKREKFAFDGPRVIYLPAGFIHYPLTVKRLKKPIVLLDIASSQKGGRKIIEDYSRYITSPSIGIHTMVTKTYRDDKLIREQDRRFKELNYTGRDAAGGGLTLFWFPVAEPHIMYEPPHSHDHDMVALFLGGDPLNVGDFHAELDMWLGEEGEKHTVRSASLVYHPKGLIHRHVDFQRVDQPFQEIHIFISPEYLKAGNPAAKS